MQNCDLKKRSKLLICIRHERLTNVQIAIESLPNKVLKKDLGAFSLQQQWQANGSSSHIIQVIIRCTPALFITLKCLCKTSSADRQLNSGCVALIGDCGVILIKNKPASVIECALWSNQVEAQLVCCVYGLPEELVALPSIVVRSIDGKLIVARHRK